MKKLCVCIPTFQRCEVIREKLNKELPFMEKMGVDIFVYDSSIDNATKNVVKELCDEGYTNLFYRQMDSDIHANIKFFNIYDEQVESGHYDYIWLIHDHSYITEKALVHLLNVCDKSYDYMFLKFQGDKYHDEAVTDLSDFLLRTAWLSTKFGACVIKSEYLRNFDFDKAKEYCCTPKRLNFAHIVFYYSLISQRKGNIAYVSFERDEIKDILQNQRPSWNKDGIRICLECWGEVITALPSEYTSKELTLRSIDQWFLSKYRFIEYKEQKIWNLKTFLRYGKWIRAIRPEVYKDALKIALYPLQLSYRKYIGEFVRTVDEHRKCGKQIYIFGAGRHAEEFSKMLLENQCDFDGFVVSNKQGNPSELDGKKVLSVDECVQPSLVIIAVQSASEAEVTRYLEQYTNIGVTYISCGI